jgi:hypothetical protein
MDRVIHRISVHIELNTLNKIVLEDSLIVFNLIYIYSKTLIMLCEVNLCFCSIVQFMTLDLYFFD